MVRVERRAGRRERRERTDRLDARVPRSRPMLRTAPSGPRSPLRTWLAAATSTGLRVARPSSRAVRALSSTARPGLRTSPPSAAQDHLAVGRDPVGPPARRSDGGQLVTLRVGVEHEGQQLDARRAVDGGVVDLGQDGEAVVGQALDDVALPQRAAAGRAGGRRCGRRGRRAGGRRPAARTAVWRTWKSRSKSGSSIQYGWSRPERHLPQATAQRLEQVQPPFELTSPRRERLVVRIVGPLEHREARDVAELPAGLHEQERGIETGELLHGRPLVWVAAAEAAADRSVRPSPTRRSRPVRLPVDVLADAGPGRRDATGSVSPMAASTRPSGIGTSRTGPRPTGPRRTGGARR